MDLHVDDLAPFVFQQNPVGRKIVLSLDGLESSKDLFFFILDLLCKGLVLMYGIEGQKMDLTRIDSTMFQNACKRMACAGIDVRLQSVDVVSDSTSIAEVSNSSNSSDARMSRGDMSLDASIAQLARLPMDTPLEDFVVRLRMGMVQHALWFVLQR
jgi:hypothetical protein